MPKMPKIYNSCTVMRRKLVKHESLNMATGESTKTHEEWVTEPCSIPLFGDEEKTGVCKSCSKGWTHPENYPVTPCS